MSGKIVAIANQKGGVGKTTTTISLGAALAQKGYRVLLVDLDSQASLTIALGRFQTEAIENTSGEMMLAALSGETIWPEDYVLTGGALDFIPSNKDMSGLEAQLFSAGSCGDALKKALEGFRELYDYILIDCMPGLGLVVVNALIAAQGIIIPLQPHPLGAKGLEQLLRTIGQVWKRNPQLEVWGVLFTMVRRSRISQQIRELVEEEYGGTVPIFQTVIPLSVKAEEAPAYGMNILEYCPRNPVAQAYIQLAEEVVHDNHI